MYVQEKMSMGIASNLWVNARKDVYSDAGSMCAFATKNVCRVA